MSGKVELSKTSFQLGTCTGTCETYERKDLDCISEYQKKKNCQAMHKEGVLLKVDLEKAYDHVDWDFLEYMLLHFGFDDRW